MNCFKLENQEQKNTLSSEQFKYYFDLYKNGDINARNIIIEHNIRLVYSTYNKHFASCYSHKEDLLSVGYMALIYAVDYYDINQGIKFSTFATSAIINNMNAYYHKNIAKAAKNLSLDLNLYTTDEGEEANLYDCIASEDNLLDSVLDKELVNYLFEILDNLNKDILEMHYGLGKYDKCYTLSEIAKKYGVTKQRILQRLNQSLKDLKKASENQNFRNQRILKKEKSK